MRTPLCSAALSLLLLATPAEASEITPNGFLEMSETGQAIASLTLFRQLNEKVPEGHGFEQNAKDFMAGCLVPQIEENPEQTSIAPHAQECYERLMITMCPLYNIFGTVDCEQ